MPDAQRLSTAILGSGFGRRLFPMFCIAALLPTAIVFWMTYRTATTDALEARREALREGGKNFAMAVHARLQLADRALATADVDSIGSGGQTHLANYFSEVSVVALPPRHDPAAGQATGRLRVDPQRGGATTLSRAVGGRLLVGTLDPGFLWGEPGEMGQAMRICMYAVRTRLFCGGHPGTEPGDRLLTANWDLFLEPDFGVAPWTVVSVSGPGSGFGRYRGVLVPAAIAVLLLAVLLSSFQIRRVLVPLSDLLRRIRALEGGSTDLHRQAGEDEFGLLSRTFGRMQERIG